MALKTYKPDHAEPAPARHRRPHRPLSRRAGEDADRGPEFDRRPQQPRPHHLALPRRRPQAGLSQDRLQAHAARRARDGRAHRIRSEPHRLHRAGEISGRRAVLHPRAAAARRRRHHRRGRAGRHQAGQRHAGRQHAGRHHRAQRRDQDRQGRPDRALGRHLRADRRPRPASTSSCGSIRPSSAWCTAAAWRPSARCRIPTT